MSKSTDKFTDKTAGKSAEKFIGRSAEKLIDRSAEHIADTHVCKSTENVTGKPIVDTFTNKPTESNTVIVTLGYFGAPFSGFARQPGQLTVQGSLEDALCQLFRRDIETTCAGRTDAGVHAKGQVISFEVTKEEVELSQFSPYKIKGALDFLTHDDIYIHDISVEPVTFSARFDAKMRHYSYFIAAQTDPSMVFRDFSWHIKKPLDVQAMMDASRHLIGEHDFRSFCVAASANKLAHTMRNISKIEFVQHEILGDSILEIQVSGNAFLHSMVRTIVGTLVKVGTGNREPSWVKEVLEAKDRQAAGECAPAKGLIFMKVDY